ncbi:MAG: hypothetical protein R3335_06200, partial [Anaerolineales bacterium]|nr:hypothetical protein [Anaerolineales bacterium]
PEVLYPLLLSLIRYAPFRFRSLNYPQFRIIKHFERWSAAKPQTIAQKNLLLPLSRSWKRATLQADRCYLT